MRYLKIPRDTLFFNLVLASNIGRYFLSSSNIDCITIISLSTLRRHLKTGKNVSSKLKNRWNKQTTLPTELRSYFSLQFPRTGTVQWLNFNIDYRDYREHLDHQSLWFIYLNAQCSQKNMKKNTFIFHFTLNIYSTLE